MKKIILPLLVLAAVLTSCRENTSDILSPEASGAYANNYTGQFQAIWNGMNTGYAAWDVETFNWDESYKIYLPIVQSWDEMVAKGVPVSDSIFLSFYNNLFKPFHDGHLAALVTNLATGNTVSVAPARNRAIEKLEAGVAPYLMNVVQGETTENMYTEEVLKQMIAAGTVKVMPLTDTLMRKYDYYSVVYPELGFTATLAVFVLDNGQLVPYLHMNQFAFTRAMLLDKLMPKTTTATQLLSLYHQTIQALGMQGKLAGVILDVRNNIGGDADDFQLVMSPFIAPGTTFNVGTCRTKNGPGRLDFGPKVPFSFNMNKDGIGYVVTREPVIALTNELSASMAEIVSCAVKYIDNGIVVGAKTLGAANVVVNDFDLFYSGSFSKAGFYEITMPAGVIFDRNGNMIDATGIVPDYEYPTTLVSMNATWGEANDPVLARAFSLAAGTPIIDLPDSIPGGILDSIQHIIDSIPGMDTIPTIDPGVLPGGGGTLPGGGTRPGGGLFPGGGK